ncbi:hypothetical protein [Anaerophilus nitritogenes]|uniref:hypothetical protein n=1 Tax=Anaerophilus nitritogenes TaxID=2498136 RepID=UPI00101BD06E|nr:hypothetical protein [Anaerophilus nitritogenes]
MGTVTFFNTTGAGSGSGIDLAQITKLNVTAPHEVNIEIENTIDFKRLPVEVLKLIPGQEDVVQTLADFDNADQTDFKKNDFVEFNGSMCLKTQYDNDLEEHRKIETGHLYSVAIDRNLYRKIVDAEVRG